MIYLTRSNMLIQKIFPDRHWKVAGTDKVLYLSFDDGPHPEATPFVLEQLKAYNAQGSFFCVGNAVKSFPEIYTSVLQNGHSVGNHTMNHLNAAKVKDDVYLKDIDEAAEYIDSKLFRPPYGRLSGFLAKQIVKPRYGLIPVMWTVLSGDFDQSITHQKCADNVTVNAKGGDIVVFHDSQKAFAHLQFALPIVLDYFANQGFRFEKLTPQLFKA